MTSICRSLLTLSELSIYIAAIGYIFSTALLQIGVYFSVGSWMLAKILAQENPIPKTPVDRSLLIILFALTVSVVVNPFYSEGLNGLHKWIRGMLLFGVAYHLFQSEKFEWRFMICLLFAYVVACIDGLWQFQFGKDFIRGYSIGYADTVKRITSSFGFFGMFASFLIITTPICIWAISVIKQKWIRHFAYITVLSLGLLNLFLTRTRGAWIVAVVITLLYLLTQKKVKWILMALSCVTIVVLLLPKDLLFHSRESNGLDKSTNHRIHLWTEAINIIKARPVFGAGLNAYVKNIEKYNPPHDGEVKNYYAHNGYLQYTAETGLVGLSAFALLLLQCVQILLVQKQHSRISFKKQMILVSLCGFLFYMLFDTIFHNMQPFILFWLLLSWCLAPEKQL